MNCKPRRRRARGRQKSGLSEAADDDHRLMAAALRLARRGLGLARPNPSVGCLIARAGPDGPLIVGQGVTSPGGRPHAEANALGIRIMLDGVFSHTGADSRYFDKFSRYIRLI